MNAPNIRKSFTTQIKGTPVLVEEYFYPSNESLSMPKSPRGTNLLHGAHVSFRPEDRASSELFEMDRRGVSMGEEMDYKSALSFNRKIANAAHLKTEIKPIDDDIRL